MLIRLLPIVFPLFAISLAIVSPAGANDPILRNDYALELLEKGEYEKAVEQLQKAQSIFGLDLTLRNNLAIAYAMLGRNQMEKQQFVEASESFAKAGELIPDDTKFSLLRGAALYHAKKPDAAKAELERARALRGDSADILYFLGRIAYDSGETGAALELWEKAALLDPADPRLKELIAKVRKESAVESRMEKGYSSRFTVSFDVDVKTAVALKLLEALEDSYNSVGSDLDHFPVNKIPVILYTRKDYKEITNSPDWSGGLYDGKIRLPIGGMTEITPQIRAVLRHEYTHALVHDLAGRNCPTWLNEGLAEMQGRKEHNTPLADLGKAAKSGAFLPFRKLEGSFLALGAAEARLAYQQSYSMVNFMVSTYGWHSMKQMLQNLGAGMAMDTAIATALAGYGLTYESMAAEWQSYMIREFGGG